MSCESPLAAGSSGTDLPRGFVTLDLPIEHVELIRDSLRRAQVIPDGDWTDLLTQLDRAIRDFHFGSGDDDLIDDTASSALRPTLAHPASSALRPTPHSGGSDCTCGGDITAHFIGGSALGLDG